VGEGGGEGENNGRLPAENALAKALREFFILLEPSSI
jgi:hypothetical protein